MKDRVHIGWIDPGQVDGAFATSLIELSRARPQKFDGIIRIEGGLLSRQRNEVVKTFLDHTHAEWLLMIDSDERISVQAFDKLVDAAHAELRPVVAGLYFGTWPSDGLMPTPVPHLYLRAGDGISVSPVLAYPPDQIIEVDAAGTGCLMVHRSVLEAIRATATEHEGPDWCWFRDLPLGGKWLGEDLYFCRRVQSLGFAIHAHTGAILPHRRRYWLNEQQFEAVRARTGDLMSKATPEHSTSEPPPTPADNPPKAVESPRPPRDTADHRPMQHRGA